MEEWRPIAGHEGYEVSSLGRVRSLDRAQEVHDIRGRTYTRYLRGRVMKASPNLSGHMGLLLGAGKGTFLVHALVAEAFIGPRPEGYDVRHLNGVHVDNRAENLSYSTRGQNVRDRKWHAGQRGRLTIPDILDIKRRLACGERQASVARAYGVMRSTVHEIKHGRLHADV